MQGIAQSMSRKLQSRVPRSTSQKTRLKSRVPSGRKERQKSAIQLPPSSGILLINTGDAAENKKISTTKENQANVKVIPILDLKGTKLAIVANWREYTPAKIVGIFRQHYTNVKSLSVMLSRFKARLAQLDDPPPYEYLKTIALTRKEYHDIRSDANDRRRRGAMNTIVVSNADAVVRQALQYLTSSDPNLLYPALLVTTGLRPIEIVKVGRFSAKLNNQQEHGSFWGCQSRFAKRGTMKTEYHQCRDRPFLAPYWLIERALTLVRKRWSVRHLSNMEINRKFSTHWGNILRKAYPMLPGITAKICRRFFAAFAYSYFSKGFFLAKSGQASQPGFTSWVLGHYQLEDTVIAYQSMVIRPQPKMKLFEIGANLKVTT